MAVADDAVDGDGAGAGLVEDDGVACADAEGVPVGAHDVAALVDGQGVAAGADGGRACGDDAACGQDVLGVGVTAEYGGAA